MNKRILQFRPHYLTLADNAPKSRRRVRKILGLPVGAPITAVDVASAVSKAKTSEFKHNAPQGKKRK